MTDGGNTSLLAALGRARADALGHELEAQRAHEAHEAELASSLAEEIERRSRDLEEQRRRLADLRHTRARLEREVHGSEDSAAYAEASLREAAEEVAALQRRLASLTERTGACDACRHVLRDVVATVQRDLACPDDETAPPLGVFDLVLEHEKRCF